ncbi:hypothetical protein SAMN04488109_5347 [Chryseolinea serpens]|uniref:Uncharacterized protein n=1 Tax=Chryseolinea serpens TaxID=947013 RepID=A0A1M5VRX2_9BACT|nr:hypothetical protein SAMN04488109_5347 [Chryseolinea serpens]
MGGDSQYHIAILKKIIILVKDSLPHLIQSDRQAHLESSNSTRGHIKLNKPQRTHLDC